MGKISYTLVMDIVDGKLDEFKSKAENYTSSTEKNEPETLGYSWFLSADNQHCMLHEAFADSEAMLAHLGNVGPTLPDLFAIAPPSRLEVFGEVSDAAREALDPLGAIYFTHLCGFNR